MDDVPAASAFAYSVSLSTGLPLLNNKMSRTPVRDARSIYSAMIGEEVDSRFCRAMKGKEILVVQMHGLDSYQSSNSMTARLNELTGSLLPGKKFLVDDESGRYTIYSWRPLCEE